MQSQTFQVNIDIFKKKALHFAQGNYAHICFLEGNNLQFLYGSFPTQLAFGAKNVLKIDSASNAFSQLKKFQSHAKNTIYGFLTYDLKNELENLASNNNDSLLFPTLLFFEPEYTIVYQANSITIQGEKPDFIFQAINATAVVDRLPRVEIESRISRTDYIEHIKAIKAHIHRGDIYELNFCQEFFAANKEINPASTFIALNQISPMPFASFFKVDDLYLICASPERYLKKEGGKIISQPIKGTVKRGKDADEDEALINSLLHSEKELAENVMIVDLVRNDLSKTAKDGSVKVEELFGIYTFPNVHQMISTVVSELDAKFTALDAIKTTFPMGSMTGAPKISAMQLIETHEETKRGLFSGAVGYFTKNGNFDFNVVIRSILYNDKTKYLSFQVGSAITIDSIPEKEWEECEVKTAAIRLVLSC